MDITNKFLDNRKFFLGYALKLTRNKEDAEDLVQETFYKVWAKKETYIEGKNFRTWVCTIMKNKFIDGLRKTRDFNLIEEEQAYQMSYEEDLYTIMLIDQIIEEIKSYKPQYRDLFLASLHGYKYKEIAEMYNISLETVKMRIHLARKKLMKTYGKGS